MLLPVNITLLLVNLSSALQLLFFPALFLLFFVQSADIFFFFFFFTLQSSSLPFTLRFCITMLNLFFILASSSLLSVPGVVVAGFNCTTTTLLIWDLAPCFPWCPAVDATMLEQSNRYLGKLQRYVSGLHGEASSSVKHPERDRLGGSGSDCPKDHYRKQFKINVMMRYW